jgi:hypothetical protein
VSNNPNSSTTASASGHSCFHPYDLSCDEKECLTPKNVAKISPAHIACAACLLTAVRIYLNSPPQSPKNWRQVNPNCNDYHSDPIEISSTFLLPDIADWWHRPEETHSMYANLSSVAHAIFSILPQGGGGEASVSYWRDVIESRQSKTTGETLWEEVVVR